MRFHEEGRGLNDMPNLEDSKQGKNMPTTETSGARSVEQIHNEMQFQLAPNTVSITMC